MTAYVTHNTCIPRNRSSCPYQRICYCCVLHWLFVPLLRKGPPQERRRESGQAREEAAQFKADHEAKIAASELVEGRKSFRGVLNGVEGEDILFTDAKAGDVRIPFALVDEAKLLLTDKLISATMPLSSDGADEFETEE